MKKKEIMNNKRDFISMLISLDWVLLFGFFGEHYPNVFRRFEDYISKIERELEIDELVMLLLAFFEQSGFIYKVFPEEAKFRAELYLGEGKNLLHTKESLFEAEEPAHKALVYAMFESLNFIIEKEKLENEINKNLN